MIVSSIFGAAFVKVDVFTFPSDAVVVLAVSVFVAVVVDAVVDVSFVDVAVVDVVVDFASLSVLSTYKCQ